jgi:hypothetical protein
VDQIVNYVLDFANKSEAQYHVNPWVFVILFFGSAIPLYFGYFLIGKSALKFEGRKLKRKKIDKRLMKVGIIVSVISWWIPYIYVIIFGKLPLELWLVFYTIILVAGVFFIRTLVKKESELKLDD